MLLLPGDTSSPRKGGSGNTVTGTVQTELILADALVLKVQARPPLTELTQLFCDVWRQEKE